MRNRITHITTALIIVILAIAAFGHPAAAQTSASNLNTNLSLSNTGSSGTSGTSGSSGLNTNLNLNNPAFNTTNSNSTSLSSGFAPVSTPSSGQLSSSGAASSGSGDISPLEPCSIWHPNIRNCSIEIMANVANTILGAVSYLVSIAGAIMSFTIVLTLHIRDFVNATPAIFEVWTTLRDVTSLFFIFFLLYAAFKIILGMDQKIGELIKNLVLAGILINFSFFITGALIDASNIVSQTLYNAMVPVSATSAAVNDIKSGDMSNMLHDVTGMDKSNILNVDNTKYGISDIFRNALKLSSVSGSNANVGQAAIADPLKTYIIIVVGIIIMITACISFLIAAAAFIIRLVALLFLLALSPLWFASWIIPQLKKEFNFAEHLYKQLVFMPVYLLLMYVALKIVAGSNLLMASNANVAGVGTVGNWAFSYIILGINFSIIIVMLNLPLVVGIKMSGHLGGMIDKFNAKKIWSNVGNWSKKNVVDRPLGAATGAAKWTAGFAARNTIGAGSMALDKKLQNVKGIGNTVLGRDILKATTGKLAENKFGTGYSASTYKKAQREALVQGAKIDKNLEFKRTLADALAPGIPPVKDPITGKPITVGTIMGKMSEKERLALLDKTTDPKELKEIAKFVDKDTMKAMQKAEETDVSLKQKIAVTQARKDAFSDALKSKDADTIKTLAKSMETSDLLDAVGGDLDNPAFLANVTSSHLKEISEKSLLSVADRKKLGQAIYMWEVNPANTKKEVHKAEPYVDKNSKEWL